MPSHRAPPRRTPARRKARQLARDLRGERPDYAYLKEVFRHLRARTWHRGRPGAQDTALRPTEKRDRRYYQTVWTARAAATSCSSKPCSTPVSGSPTRQHPPRDVDLDACRIRITQGKGAKDRYVPFPATFKETLALHISAARTRRGLPIRVFMEKADSTAASAPCSPDTPPRPDWPHNMPPHRLRHFLFTWLKTQASTTLSPALLRPCHPHLPGDLQPTRPRRCPAHLRQRHRPVPRLKIIRFAAGDTFLTDRSSSMARARHLRQAPALC